MTEHLTDHDEAAELRALMRQLGDEADRILMRTHDDALPADVRALLERMAGAA